MNHQQTLTSCTIVLLVALQLAALSIFSVSCTQPKPSEPIGDYDAFPAASDFTEGINRFPFSFRSSSGNRLPKAKVYVSFSHSDDRQSEARPEVQATYHPIKNSGHHFHLDGSHHIHTDDLGFYMVRSIEFDKAGVWQAKFTVRSADEKRIDVAPLVFLVRSESNIPKIGEAVPHSNNPTLSNKDDLSDITTHPNPNPKLYDVTISHALRTSRPLVVVFSTPAYCTSRLCGPVTDLAYAIYDRYSDVLDVIHIEPFEVSTAKTKGRLTPTPTLREWGLETEPWLFIIDKNGLVFDRFEGPIPPEFLEESIQSVIG